ncbi:putative multi-domain containing protein [Aduncisulcus paluster]|uniref:Phosphatidate cytidylyltransferase n=1 Tax=Aduncisulcus paluster TaxID=2918883 RepID=A0ABQ5K2T6_9EUKA|nr:putative multi-domain containing protein [Aduncisulcus paluster]
MGSSKKKAQRSNRHKNDKRQSAWKKFLVRALSGVIMAVLVIVFVLCGENALVIGEIFCMRMVFYEILSLSINQDKEKTYGLHSQRFGMGIFWVFLTRFIFLDEISPYISSLYPIINDFFKPILPFVTACIVLMVIVFYILSLNSSCLPYQFKIGAFIVTGLLITISAAKASIHTVLFQGLGWLLLRIILVSVNDVGAYLCGVTLGKHSLIKLSPKKTWEGYLGAIILTVACGIALPIVFKNWPSMFAPRMDVLPFIKNPFSRGTIMSEVSDVAIETKNIILFDEKITVFGHVFDALTFHFGVIAIMISIIGPFGGFFASGLKRALKIKDFGESIPGHGGFTDRLDCQMYTTIFISAYVNCFVNTGL